MLMGVVVRRCFLFLLFLLVLIPLVPVPAAATADDTLYGRKWMLVYMASTPPAKDARAGMTLDKDGRLNGTGGCNTLVGVAKISDVDKTIFIGQLTSTLKGCAPDVMAQEIGFTAALEKANIWEIEENKLHLRDATGVLLLSFMADPLADKAKQDAAASVAAAPKHPAIVGKDWVVEDIRKRGIIDRSRMTMFIAEDGRMSGNTGCNHFFGQVGITDKAIETGAMNYTRRACLSDAVRKQESQYLRALETSRAWEIKDDGLLYMKDSSGNEVLRFAPAYKSKK